VKGKWERTETSRLLQIAKSRDAGHHATERIWRKKFDVAGCWGRRSKAGAKICRPAMRATLEVPADCASAGLLAGPFADRLEASGLNSAE